MFAIGARVRKGAIGISRMNVCVQEHRSQPAHWTIAKRARQLEFIGVSVAISQPHQWHAAKRARSPHEAGVAVRLIGSNSRAQTP